MNARQASGTDRHSGPATGDGLAAVLRLPLFDGAGAVAADYLAASPGDLSAGSPITLLVLAEHHSPSRGFYTRALGLNDRLSVAETVRAVLIAFDWPGAARMLDEPADTATDVPTWSLQARRSDRLRVYSRTAGPVGTPLDVALGRDGTATLLVEGTVITLTTAGAMARDEHTPDAVCLAGEFVPESREGPQRTGRTVAPNALVFASDAAQDEVNPRDVDLAAVNVALTGEETVEQILSGIAPELRELLLDGNLYEFTPLLQALDMERPAQVPEVNRRELDRLPVETTAVGRAASWSRIIALSTLSDRATSDEIAEMLMSALGFTRADAGLGPGDGRLSADPLRAAEIRELSVETGRVLASCGADAWQPRGSTVTPLVPRCSLVERLEMYRYLLQRRDTSTR